MSKKMYTDPINQYRETVNIVDPMQKENDRTFYWVKKINMQKQTTLEMSKDSKRSTHR